MSSAHVDYSVGRASTQTVKKGTQVGGSMAKKDQGPGIQSAAGLIRYFDAEETTNIKIPPMFVIGLTVVTAVGVILMTLLWKF